MKIWFDMDGTIADLYGVTDWLPAILARDTRPYEIARGIGNLALIARLLNKAQANGHEIGIISWTAKNAPAAALVITCGTEGVSDDVKAQVEALINDRADAKKAKDFAKADAIRDQLTAMGVTIVDVKGGVNWTKA